MKALTTSVTLVTTLVTTLVVTLLLASTEILAEIRAQSLGLEQAIYQAVQNDGWLKSSELIEAAFRDEAKSQGALPDPTMSLGVANLPADSWEFDQENMTQLKVGITQRFPGGASRGVKARKSQLMADVNPYRRLERKALLTKTVSHLWLDSYLAFQSIKLIENERYLFGQLVDVTTARYQSALGKARQQDVVRAQLESTKLEDRLTRLRLQYDTNRQLLAEWLPTEAQGLALAEALPKMLTFSSFSVEALQRSIRLHPQLSVIDKRIEIQQADIDLAREDYKPDWALKASYAYREDAPTDMERSDFFSVGVSLDLPVFTEYRQDKIVSAARSRKQALSIDYQLLQKKLLSNGLKTLSEIERLEQRSRLYQTKLLNQAHEQAEAALSAYTNDDGDFADVMRAYIAELNSKIEALEINIKQRKALATMNYLLAGSDKQLQE